MKVAEAYGKSFADWIGGRVQIRAETTSFNGKQVPCLRLYPEPDARQAPVAPAARPEAPSRFDELNDEMPDW